MTAPSTSVREVREDPLLGAEQRCATCGDWWPADLEFFYFSKGRPMVSCKACTNERVRATDRAREARSQHLTQQKGQA